MPNSLEPSPAPGGVRFPISAKIFLWFALNLAFLGAAAWIFARAQLHLGLDSLLGGPVSERLQTMAEVLTRQLEVRPAPEWPAILASTGDSYHVHMALYRNDGKAVAGIIPEPPPEVIQRIKDARPRDGMHPEPLRNGPPEGRPPPAGFEDNARGALPPGRPPRDGAGLPPPPEVGGPPAPPEGRPESPPPPLAGGYPKSMLHTHRPSLYWVFVRMPMRDRGSRPPMPLTLVLATDSLRGGGLLFDYRPWLIGGSAVFALSVVMWLPLVRGITRSLRQMTRAAESIAQGRFETQAHAPRSDELGRLGTALNYMSARLREFFTGQKRFLGDIAHELCSPLARMEMALGILEQRADEKQRDYVNDVREELRHMSELVHELLSFSKAGVGGVNVELKRVPLAEMASRVVAREAKDRGGVVVNLPGTLAAMAEPDLLSRALGNVIRNALRYAAPAHSGAESYSYRPAMNADGQPAGPITVSACDDGTHVVLSVRDCGPGVPQEALHRLFDPFFRPESARTRETGGAGLGLAIVKSCIEACGGTVAVRNVQPSGLQVDFTLQRVAP